MAEEQCEVAVIGAGPVGLTLVLGLARGGRSVNVLEKASGTSDHSRAPIIWPRTQEVFAAFGVECEILEHSLVLRAVRIVDADRSRRVLSFALRSLDRYTDYPQVLLCPQSRTEAVLLSAVRRECGARVAFDSEVTDVTNTPNGVFVHYPRGAEAHTVAARFAAGCDGAQSVVLASIGPRCFPSHASPAAAESPQPSESSPVFGD